MRQTITDIATIGHLLTVLQKFDGKTIIAYSIDGTPGDTWYVRQYFGVIEGFVPCDKEKSFPGYGWMTARLNSFSKDMPSGVLEECLSVCGFFSERGEGEFLASISEDGPITVASMIESLKDKDLLMSVGSVLSYGPDNKAFAPGISLCFGFSCESDVSNVLSYRHWAVKKNDVIGRRKDKPFPTIVIYAR